MKLDESSMLVYILVEDCCSGSSKLQGSLSHGLNDNLVTEGHCWFASKMNKASEILNVASTSRTSNLSKEILKSN